jgi:hypothetical protein
MTEDVPPVTRSRVSLLNPSSNCDHLYDEALLSIHVTPVLCIIPPLVGHAEDAVPRVLRSPAWESWSVTTIRSTSLQAEADSTGSPSLVGRQRLGVARLGRTHTPHSSPLSSDRGNSGLLFAKRANLNSLPKVGPAHHCPQLHRWNSFEQRVQGYGQLLPPTPQE